MISSRAIASPRQDESQTVGSAGTIQAQSVRQDDQGPLDRELLDLYVAILIAVPLGCFLKFLWS
ncbi:hypothetical protein [Reyranella sp.]|jgi:hypothetical protein|uniref:hypothetical protein n=1 Tax=Reyranella sp. TaxID=1929291 RepID=UPI003D12E916